MDKKILRVIDANFNRCKEGLRVIEDVFRFILEDDNLRKKIRNLRHSLDETAKDKILGTAVLSRNSKRDLGKKTDSLEIKRDNSVDILYINFQRVKESLRVLEEFFKIIVPGRVDFMKKLRYKIYAVEKSAFVKYSLPAG